MMANDRLGHEGENDRRRIGKASGFDGQAVERRDFATFAFPEEVAHGLGQVAADGAADTAALQDDGFRVDPLQQQVVEADLA